MNTIKDGYFRRFITSLAGALSEPLPGRKAQFKMAPYERVLKALARKFTKRTPRESAVLCLLYPKLEEPHFALILRNTYEGVHSGQISFPGGKEEEGDDTHSATALRETEEEIGVPRELVKVLGKLTDVYIPPSGFTVHPYIGYCRSTPVFIPDPAEVSKVIEAPVRILMDDAIIGRKKITVSTTGWKINYPYYEIQGETVWGATAMMLSELKAILKSAGFQDPAML